jgi:hypothetical protein
MNKPINFINNALAELLDPLKDILNSSSYCSKLIITNGSAFIYHDTKKSRPIEMNFNFSDLGHLEFIELNVTVLALESSDSEYSFVMNLSNHLGVRPKYEVKGYGESMTVLSYSGNIDKELKRLAISIIDTLTAIRVLDV